jgi:hypothetical protein
MFIESAYFTAEYLNMWMQSYNDDILYELFDDWADTLRHNPYVLEFFKTIKSEFPETIFHGVDIGHGYLSSGRRFLQYLIDNNKQGTEQYLLTLESIEQGEHYYKTFDLEFRINKMTENFIRTFDLLYNQNIMGIFGVSHIVSGYMELMGLPDVPNMAERLLKYYGNSVHTEDLSWLGIEINPIRDGKITINDADYKVSYFGTDFTAFRNIVAMSFWRLENAYDDFSGKPTTGDVLPFSNFPMDIELNQVFIVDVTLTDGSILRMFYRSDGDFFQDRPTTTGFIID